MSRIRDGVLVVASSLRRLSAGFWKNSPFRLFAVAGLIGAIAILAASVVASGRAGEREAITDVKRQTRSVADTVVQPNLTQAMLDGDAEAIQRFRESVEPRLLTGTTVRVKLWDSDGVVIYSDVEELIGEQYELGDEKEYSLWNGNTVAEISSLEGPENRFERGGGDLLEVYFPISGPNGSTLLYESYFDLSQVTESAARIRSIFIPTVVVPVLLLEVIHLALAWGLSRRMAATQEERERLLRRAVESSDLERRRIAGELHDGVVQDLVGTSLSLTAAAETVGRGSPELAADLNAAATSTRRSLQSLRSLLVEIYPPNLQENGLEAALIDLLAPAPSLGVETILSVEGDVDADPRDAALAYRVIQESVRNVFRHAEATSLEVDIRSSSSAMVAVVKDDGSGFTPGTAENGHFGLRLLSDLIADTGALFDIDSAPGQGTTIRLEVPR